MMSTIRAWSALAVVAITLPAVAADLHVPGDHRTIQGAIDAAAPHDTVIVADGIWTGAGNVDLNYGGKAIVVRSANGPSNCIIDCNATPEHPARGVNFVSGETAAAVFEGFTIRNGATPPGAIADLFNGAAILCNNGSSPTIRNCVCRDNHAGCWGGAICCTNASPTIVGCVLIDNLVDDDGGGLFAWGQSSPTVVNTLITGNHSLITAGGIADFCFGNDFGFTLVNCTVTGNTAEWQGGGGQMFGSTLTNCIVWGNLTINGNSDDSGISGATVTHSCIAGGAAGEGNVDADPGFVDAAAGNYRLGAGSPCLDAGAPGPVPATVDVDGQPRVMGAAVDMGIDERPSPDLDGDTVVDAADLAALLSQWGSCLLCAADLDEDGAISSTDLAAMLAAWGR